MRRRIEYQEFSRITFTFVPCGEPHDELWWITKDREISLDDPWLLDYFRRQVLLKPDHRIFAKTYTARRYLIGRRETRQKVGFNDIPGAMLFAAMWYGPAVAAARKEPPSAA